MNPERSKAMETAAKIATFRGVCLYPDCNRTREGGHEIYGHHIVHRKYANTCADPENLFPCCVEHHAVIHHNETAFKTMLEASCPRLYEKLWAKAREISKPDFEEIYAVLLERLYGMYQEQRAVAGKSKCCGSPVIVRGDLSKYYECTGCGNACDLRENE